MLHFSSLPRSGTNSSNSSMVSRLNSSTIVFLPSTRLCLLIFTLHINHTDTKIFNRCVNDDKSDKQENPTNSRQGHNDVRHQRIRCNLCLSHQPIRWQTHQ